MKTTRRQAIALLGTSALVACGATPGPVSQSDYDPFEGGIGGTGIVGVLNGFSSLLISGLRVQLSENTRYRTSFGRIARGDLQRGQLLTVSAVRNRDGLFARDVSVDYALIGTLEQSATGLSVNGVAVRLADGAIGAAGVGARVAVSGVWRGDGVVATRIDPAVGTDDLIAGTVDRDTRRAYRIGGAPVSGGLSPATGSFAAALGTWEGDGFAARDVAEGRFPGRASLSQLAVEGYLELSSTAPGFRIAGLGHSFARDLRLGQIGARRAVYFGQYDGQFRASKGYVVPEGFEARRTLLSAGLGDAFGGDVVRL